jgi:hypothetical protein
MKVDRGTKRLLPPPSGTTIHNKPLRRECLVCQGTEDLTTDVGWVGDVQVKVHSYHLGLYRLGRTIPPPHPAADARSGLRTAS